MSCDKRIPIRFKGKVYGMVVRSTLLYSSKCWPIKKIQSSDIDGSRDEVDSMNVFLYKNG